jgi:hypothetical protein
MADPRRKRRESAVRGPPPPSSHRRQRSHGVRGLLPFHGASAMPNPDDGPKNYQTSPFSRKSVYDGWCEFTRWRFPTVWRWWMQREGGDADRAGIPLRRISSAYRQSPRTPPGVPNSSVAVHVGRPLRHRQQIDLPPASCRQFDAVHLPPKCTSVTNSLERASSIAVSHFPPMTQATCSNLAISSSPAWSGPLRVGLELPLCS